MGQVTLQEVADRAGVSMKTVSNVVRGYQHVSPAMRQRVQAVVDELGYRPNRSGRSLATGRSSMLGLAFPDLRRPYFAELAHMFARVAAARGFRLLLSETGGTPEGERSVFRDRESGTVDGLVMQPQAMSALELDELRNGMPVVFLGEGARPAHSDQVNIDNVAAAAESVEHLAQMGRRRIGFLGHEIGELSRTSSLRLDGYRRGLSSAGLSNETGLLVPRGEGDALGAEVALEAALDRGLDLDALLCRDDLAAIGALRVFSRRHIDVPGDLAVIGWDAIDLGASTAPSLTSVAPDTHALAEQALDLLISRLNGNTAPGRHVTVGHRLLFRESAPEQLPTSSIESNARLG